MASSLALKSLGALGHVKAGVLGEGSSTSSKPRERSADHPVIRCSRPEIRSANFGKRARAIGGTSPTIPSHHAAGDGR